MNKLYNDTAVQAIANAIRAKNGSSDTYTIAEMSTALNDLSYYAKPTISNVPLATFEADGLPLNSLKVSVEAKQAGSGTPSPENIRPITGWDAVVVSDCGKNLFDGTFLQGYWRGTDGAFVSSSLWVATDKIPCLGNVDYVISANSYTTRWQAFLWYDADGNYISQSGTDVVAPIGFSAKSPVNARYLVVDIAGTTPQTEIVPSDVTNFQVELGTSSTTYVPYNPDSFTTTIPLGQTVYGAEVDVVNGILKITDGYIASYNGETLPSTWISSMDEYAEGTSPTTGAEVCYELANPIIINLTPSLIKSLNGQNNLSVDCGEIIELEYFKEV